MVGVFGTILFMRFRSSFVTREGVTGTTGVNGWYGEYGTAPAVRGVLPVVGESGPLLSKTVCLVVRAMVDGDAMGCSYARSGNEPPVLTADGALPR